MINLSLIQIAPEVSSRAAEWFALAAISPFMSLPVASKGRCGLAAPASLQPAAAPLQTSAEFREIQALFAEAFQ